MFPLFVENELEYTINGSIYMENLLSNQFYSNCSMISKTGNKIGMATVSKLIEMFVTKILDDP